MLLDLLLVAAEGLGWSGCRLGVEFRTSGSAAQNSSGVVAQIGPEAPVGVPAEADRVVESALPASPPHKPCQSASPIHLAQCSKPMAYVVKASA